MDSIAGTRPMNKLRYFLAKNHKQRGPHERRTWIELRVGGLISIWCRLATGRVTLKPYIWPSPAKGDFGPVNTHYRKPTESAGARANRF